MKGPAYVPFTVTWPDGTREQVPGFRHLHARDEVTLLIEHHGTRGFLLVRTCIPEVRLDEEALAVSVA